MSKGTTEQRIGEFLAEQLSGQLCQIASEIFEEDRPLLALLTAQSLARISHLSTGAPLGDGHSAVGQEDWVKITSLSQLRALVGGRFQQLKERWVSAGFPLREHRGDRSKGAEVEEEGWRELAIWISRQGFEARRNAALTDELFAVRPSNRGSK